MNPRWGRLAATALAAVAGFAGGSAATLVVVLVVTARHATAAKYPWLMTGLIGASTLVAVLVTLVVSLWSTAEVRRLAGELDRIAAPLSQTAPVSGPAPRTDEALRHQAAAPGSGPLPIPLVAAQASVAVKTKFTGTIGGPQPLEPNRDGFGWPASDETTPEKARQALPATSGVAGSGSRRAPAAASQDDVPLSPSTPDSERLVELWANYLARGDGHFEPTGLQRQLDAAGLAGKVVSEEDLGDGVLGVDLGDGRVYILPHFNSTPREVARWFQPRAGASTRLSRVQRLVQVAVARRAGNGRLEPATKGTIE